MVQTWTWVCVYVCEDEGCQRAAPACERGMEVERKRERMEGRSDISHVACSHIDAQGYTHMRAGTVGGGLWGGGLGDVELGVAAKIP